MSGIKRSDYTDIQDLKRLLTDQYDQRSLWKELVQNADDAGAKHLHFTHMSEIAGQDHPLLAAPALCVLNDGAFSKDNAERILYMGLGSKGAEAGAIGKFGLGMKSIFHLCEAFFYLASPNQEAAKDKNPEEHYWECLNPWENTDVHPTWNTGCPDGLQKLAKPLIEAIEKWPHNLDRWFALWIPLRTRKQIDGKYPLTETYEKPQDVFPADLSTNLATLLPLMQNLETISVWKDTIGGQQKQFSLQASPETTRRQGPTNLDAGNENKLSGTILSTRSPGQQINTSLSFAGSEVQLNNTELESLKSEENGWPTSPVFNNVTGKEKIIPEIAIPHAAALWSKSHSNKNEPAKLIIGDAVFLPLPDSTEEVSLISASSQFRLMLHGYFFLDAGRRHLHNDPDKVQGKWNERLREVGTLPLVLPALSDFVKHAALSTEEIRALSQGFEKSKCWNESKVRLGDKHQWLYRIAPGGGHWLLLDAQEEYRILPEPQKDQSNLPFTVFPALRDLSKTKVFTFKGWPCLSKRNDSAWDDGILELLLEGVEAKRVFRDSQSFKYFNDVLDLAHPRNEKITIRLIEFAREALIELDWKVLKNCKQEWQRLLRVLPDSKWISFPPALTSENDKAREAMLRDLLSLQLQRLVIPPELAPDQDKSEKFSLSDAQKLFNWLEKNRTEASRGKLVPEILNRTTGSLNEKRSFCGSQRLFKVREWISGIEDPTERHLTWDELEDCRIKETLWGNHKSGEELLSAWQKATNNTTLCALIEDGVRPFSKVLFASPPINFNNADCMGLLSRPPELRSAEDRKDLFVILSKSIENDTSIKALRYLLHGKQLHANNLTVSLLVGGEEDKNGQTWRKLTERILVEEKGSWRCVSNDLTELLSSQQKASLDVCTVNKSSVAKLMAQYTGDISTLNLGRELEEVERHHALKELGESEDSSLWFKLALHQTIDGQLVSIDPTKTFINSDVPVPELLRSEVVLLKSPTPPLLDIYKRHGIKEWDWKEVLRFASQHPDPVKLSKDILDALGHTKDEIEDFSPLSNIAWLPHHDGNTAVKPDDVIFLPEIKDDLSRLLSSPSLKGVWFSPSSLSYDVTKHSSWSTIKKELLPKRNKALEMLGECLTEHGGYHLGALRSLQEIADNSTESTKALDDLLVTFDGAPDDLLPLIPLLRALTKGTELLPLLKLLNNEIAPQQLVKCLQFLEQRCQETSSTQRKTCKKVHSWYLEVLAAHTDFKPALLAALKLPNKRDQWMRTRSLCLEAEGLDEQCVLHEELAESLRSQLKISPLQSGEASSKQNEDFGEETDVAPHLEKYFSSWRGLVPDECIGLLLSLLGDTSNLHQLAKGYLGNRDLESIRGRLLRLEPTRDFNINYGFLVNIVKNTSDNTYVGLNLLGEKTKFCIAETFEHLVIGNLGWEYRKEYTKTEKGCFVVHLRKIEPNDFPNIELKNLLHNTILQILEKGHKSTEHSLDEVWEDLAQTEQADLEVAQSMILENAFFYFNQLPSKPNGNLKRIVKEWDNMRHLIVEESRAGNSSGGRSEKKKQELSKELRELLLYDGVTQDQTLQAIRKKVQQAEYKADSIPFELFQNADDAAIELVDGCGQNLREQVAQQSQRIVVQWDEKYFQLLHWGRAINDFRVGEVTSEMGREKGYHRDLEKMLILQSSDKADDETTTGKFGLGFKSVFLATRTPRVLSGQLGFEVVGGMYPRHLEANENERLKKLLDGDKENNNQRGTIIELPLDAEYLSDSSPHWLERFERLLPLLLVFARRLKRCNINSPVFVWNETIIDNQGYVATGDLRNVINSDKQDALPPRGLVLRVAPPQQNLKGALLLGLDARGFRALPSDIPAFWATAPTRETISVGFALDGNWTLDVGRAQLAHGEDNLTEAQRLGHELSKPLEMLFEASMDWAAFKSILKLADDVSSYEFWNSFWKIVSAGICKSDERLKCVLWEEKGAITQLITHKEVLPTGLPGNFEVLICLDQAQWVVERVLKSSDVFANVSKWNSFTKKWHPQQLVSETIVKALDNLLPKTNNWQPLQLLDVLKQDAESELLPDQATRWAKILIPLWEKLDETEKQELTEWLKTRRFRASDNKPCEASRLLVRGNPKITSVEEDLRAHFAPKSYVLSADYDDAGIELFTICREKMSADAQKLATWGKNATDEDTQAAFLNYLLEGDLRQYVAEAMHEPESGWLFELKENPAFNKLSNKDQISTLNSLNLLPLSLLSYWESDTELQTSSIPVDVTKTLNQVYSWWSNSTEDKLREYEKGLFPQPQLVYLHLKDGATTPAGRKAWLAFLLRGSLESMGQVTEAQQKGFIALCERKGWIEELSQSRPAAKELGAVIEKYFDEQTDDLPYLRWIRHGLPLLLLSRWLDEYIGLFQGLDTRKNLDMSFLSSRVDSAMSGGGYNAPPLEPILGIGTHWVLRELVRKGIVTTSLAHPFCYHPAKATRDVINALGGPDLENIQDDRPEQSKQIHLFLRKYLGDKATFSGAFDLPLALWRKNHHMLTELKLNIPELAEEGDDNE